MGQHAEWARSWKEAVAVSGIPCRCRRQSVG